MENPQEIEKKDLSQMEINDIADLVEFLSGKQLILTHTIADVNFIERMLANRELESNRYKVRTIDSFCYEWVRAYRAHKMDKMLSSIKRNDKNAYYAKFYNEAIDLFSHKWVGSVLRNSYSGIIVDEYQDCTDNQQVLIEELKSHLPVRVFEDSRFAQSYSTL